MTETTEPKQAIIKQQITTGNRGLQLNSLEDMYRFGQYVVNSGLAPDSFKTPEQVLVALQTGAEINLSPMQSLNSFVVIHGKPTLWGDAALALVKKSGLCEYCKEYYELKGVKLSENDVQYADLIGYPEGLMAVCETKRKGEDEPVKRYFSVADAKLAYLWAKKGKKGGITPWCTHPKRMLKYKARAFNLRDNFPDVLFGMHLTEEMYGEEPLPAPESDVLPREERRSLAVPSSTVNMTRAPVQEAEPAPDEEEKPEVETAPDSEEKPSEPSTEEKADKGEDATMLYIEVNSIFLEHGGKDFVEFTAYVLCLDEDEISPNKLTIEQLHQIKAYIETSGVETG